MLKIYLDWNIITHLKDDNDTSKELLNAIRDYHDFFIFPFSAAHLRDLCKGDKNCPGFKRTRTLWKKYRIEGSVLVITFSAPSTYNLRHNKH